MSNHQPPVRSVAVIGGGISGLAAAHRIVELDPTVRVSVFEARDRLGGVLETASDAGFLSELSADSFITNLPWAVDLCRRLGLQDELLETNKAQRQALVVHRGRLHKVPDGFMLMAPTRIWPILASDVLSLGGKLRLLAEYFVPRKRDQADESLASFARRRLGREAFERLVQPLVGGIYTADPEKLSIAATMPRFLKAEQTHGSLIRGNSRSPRDELASDGISGGVRYGLFVTLNRGLSSLVDALASRLPAGSVHLGARIDSVARRPSGGWTISTSTTSDNAFDAVVLALPSFCAAQLLAGIDSELAADLDSIVYAGCAIALVGYRRDQIAHALDGFGFVVPAIENRRILAASFSSVKFPGRAPDSQVLIRVFLGGACQESLLDQTDDQLKSIAEEELAALLGIRGAPTFSRLARWPRSMPQYHVSHLELVERIEQRAGRIEGLALAGNAYHGVGIPACIRSGELAAERVLGKVAAS